MNNHVFFSCMYNTIKLRRKAQSAIEIVGYKSSELKMAFAGVSSLQFIGDICG